MASIPRPSGRPTGEISIHTVASSTDALPSDVLSEILLRVPAKQLRRLRAICRSWRSLVTDPSFAAAHRARHPDHIALSVHNFCGPNEIGVDILDLSGTVVKRLSAAVGGGVLFMYKMCAHQDLICIFDTEQQRLAVLDPAAAAAAVSLLPEDRGPLDTIESCALGLTAETGEYKVLAFSTRPPDKHAFKVFTVGGSGAWREAGSPPGMAGSRCRDMVAVDGLVYCALSHIIYTFDHGALLQEQDGALAANSHLGPGTLRQSAHVPGHGRA